ncbi:MAG: cytochrome c3 family protein [Thermodesulfobacteriota bacterium]
MKKRGLWIILLVAGIATLFIAGGLFAAGKAPDVIKMQNKAYEKHTKGIVEFSHKKHAEEYAKKSPELYKNGCGECHHDDKGKPLSALKETDPVKSCAECHKKPGEKPKGKDAPKLTKKQELEYHAEAIHDNCKGCHKNFNTKTKSKAAPETCAKCHPGKEK